VYRARGRIVLGSGSPRRRELLALAGIELTVRATGVPEDARDGEGPHEHALRLARDKALAASSIDPGAVALGADTIVVVDGEILGKPRDGAEAVRMLLSLAGRTHEVLTGWALARDGVLLTSDVSRTEVEFRPLTHAEASLYAATGEPLDKAGAYGIQGQGALFVRAIRGSYTNVVGLPLVEVLAALLDAGVIAPCEVAS